MQTKSDNTVTTDKIVLTQEGEQGRLSPYMMFKYSIRSELTRKYYERRLRGFFDYTQLETGVKDMEKRCNDFAESARNNSNWMLNQIVIFLHFQKQRVEDEEITAATLKNFVKSLKVFCDSADLEIRWKKITRGLPKGRQAANDRAPTIEEIRKFVEYPDRRIKAIIYTMVSSGIRLGSWDYLQWNHIEPTTKENGEVIAAKLRVYAGDIEEYYTFITPEAYNTLKEWMDFPLSSDHEVVMSWTPIYEDSNIWSLKKLINEHSRFRNVATVFGKTHIKDKNGQDLFLSGFDCDSDFVYQILTSEIRNPELNSKVHNLISNFGAPNSDFAASASSLLDLLIQITVVVKTGKECGYHFYWFSHKQNGHIKTEDCVAGRQFEIKTDKASGHSTLPPSSYRKNPQVKYRYITKRDKIAVLDELYEILNELLADCLLTKHNNNYGSHRNADNKKLDVFYQTNPIILKNDQIMESVSQLASCYQEHHRNDIVFEFGGLSFKQHIAEVSAVAIIKELCKQTNDSEKDNRLDTIHRTYVNGANGYNISGSSGLKKVIAGVQGYDGEKAEQIVYSLVDIWHRHEIPLDSLRLSKIPSLSDEQLDKIKITSKDIEYCISTILKEAPNEQIPVRQLFVGICSSSTHIPQNIGIRTQSGAGKNYLLNKVIAKFPQDNIVNLSDMTPKALFHDQGISSVKNLKTGEYEPLSLLGEKIDLEIENNEEQIEAEKAKGEETHNKEKIKQLKKEIKNLEKEKKSLNARVVKIIDLDGKILAFLDTPNYNLLTNIAPILSHDKYEQEYKFVESNSGPIRTKINVIRGFPTLIFAQASDNSNKERSVEVNRRYLSISVNTSEKKVADAVALKVERAGGARGEYDLKIVDREEVERTKITLAVLLRKLEKLSTPYKQQLREDKTRKLDDIDSGTFIPFKEVLKIGLPHKHIMDMTSAETFDTYLTLLAKINVDSRPKLVYSDDVVVPIATFEDLATAMSLLQSNSNTGISPEQQQWYEDIFLPVYNEKLEKQKQREKEDKEKEREELVSLETTDLIKKHEELSKIGGGRGGYTVITSKDILQKYLYSFIDNGYVEKEKVPGRRGSLYRPIKQVRYSFHSFSNEKNIFPCRLKMKVEKLEILPTQKLLELQILESLKYSSKYSEKRGISFKLVDVDGVTEITAKELVIKYFNNPEDYFILSSKTDKDDKTRENKGEDSNEDNTSNDKRNNNNSINIEADKRNNKHHKNTDNNNCQGKEQLEERILDSQNDNKLQIDDQHNIKSAQSSCKAVEKTLLSAKKEQIEYFESNDNVKDASIITTREENKELCLEYHYGNDEAGDV